MRLAEIEHELDVKSTFFFRIHGEFYNIFEQPTYKKIQKIISLGHEIGIHFEYFFYDNIKSKSVLDQKLKFEKNILEKTFNVKIKAFSFHNPEIKNALRINENKLVGMINTYGKSIKKNIITVQILWVIGDLKDWKMYYCQILIKIYMC